MIERRTEYDPNKLLTRAALYFVGILIVFVCFIIGIQILKAGEANTESWAALTGIIGWATAQAQMLYSNRFGSTLSASHKDATLARIAEQSAPVSAAAVAAATGAPAVPAVQPTQEVKP